MTSLIGFLKKKGMIILKEILGAELDQTLKNLNINAKKTYQIKNKNGEYCEDYQVWELTDENFQELDNASDWKDDWGWWRYADGSNMGAVNRRYNINNHYIKAWDGTGREDLEKENKNLSPDDRYIKERKYKNILEYFSEEIGASTERNICALAIDLAGQNNMIMGELFNKYQG
jgi:hypothetical protein